MQFPSLTLVLFLKLKGGKNITTLLLALSLLELNLLTWKVVGNCFNPVELNLAMCILYGKLINVLKNFLLYSEHCLDSTLVPSYMFSEPAWLPVIAGNVMITWLVRFSLWYQLYLLLIFINYIVCIGNCKMICLQKHHHISVGISSRGKIKILCLKS